MIYLIQVRYEKQVLLKIGYTEDSRKQSRYNSYRLHNPLFEILYEIPDATEEYEKLLQKYFREFQYQGYGNEWFEYSEEIVDYFRIHRTLDSLQDLYNKGIVIDRSEFNRFRNYVIKIVTSIINIKISQGDITLEGGTRQVDNLVDNILIKNKIRSFSRLWEYINRVFGYKEGDLLDSFTDEVENFLRGFDSLTKFTDKMKLLCDNVNQFTRDEFESILNSINIIFKNYFITLGKDRIRSLQYKKSVLETEYERIKNNQENSGSLEEVIYSIFQVGEKYLKSDIKNKLLEIYTKCNIKASPKATDLENYFGLKLVDVIDSTGKRTKGFKLISKKNDISNKD